MNKDHYSRPGRRWRNCAGWCWIFYQLLLSDAKISADCLGVDDIPDEDDDDEEIEIYYESPLFVRVEMTLHTSQNS